LLTRNATHALDFGRDVLRRLGPDIVDADLGAFARGEETHLAAESRTTAGYQHDLVFKSHSHGSPLLFRRSDVSFSRSAQAWRTRAPKFRGFDWVD